jgi:hypothetical protein
MSSGMDRWGACLPTKMISEKTGYLQKSFFRFRTSEHQNIEVAMIFEATSDESLRGYLRL